MTLSLSKQRTTPPVAQLGSSHGYRFEGDTAHLNAEILCDESRLCGQTWSLQLWTDEGIKIAELPLGQLVANGGGRIDVAGATPAYPPSSTGPHIISLLLTASTGTETTIEDLASYPQPVSFTQPRLQGTVCTGFGESRIRFDIARISNPRPLDNISGTLALELWCLEHPYTGGAWAGEPIASVILGTLAGNSEWLDCHYDIPAAPLPASGHLTLMLREWTSSGYLTRDYRTLTRPTPAAAAQPTATKSPADIEKTSGAKKSNTKKAADSSASLVSINDATLDALKSVKGLTKTLAAAIIASRPYAALDELVRAKGMGPKLLEKIRSNLKL